ncbi:MAG: glutamate synthase subunit beta [Rikenellaceae bacterium]|jgi:glutamate synthase (NADPH/NADH) small chain|nr:glutamate synthase subunit beta [Rikenellaceae bacterium]
MGNPKAFLQIGRKEAGYRALTDRVGDYAEVEQTLNTEDRRLQASRCMDCGVPFCHWACPLGNRQPEWQDALYRGKWQEAYRILISTNDFPEFTGRVCPALCEKSCVLALSHDAVTIRENEVAVAEMAFEECYVNPRIPAHRHKHNVAVVGSGPAGLAAANQLNQLGFNVTVYEKDEAVGGLLRLGIPDFKLNKRIIDRRVELMEREGVRFVVGAEIGGEGYAVSALLADYDAVCVCIGSGVPRDISVEGRELKGVHFALEFLQQQNRVVAGALIPDSERISARGKHVLVIGGGDTGSDCVGTSVRQGALSVTQIEIMPKPPEGDNPETPWPMWPVVLKTSSSHEEGCTRRWQLDTRRFVGKNGSVTGAEVEEVEWVVDTATGARKLSCTGRKETIKADLVLLAMGFVHPVHEGLVKELGVELDSRKNIRTGASGSTSSGKVFAAGDAASGASLVVRAIASGRRAAEAIEKSLLVKSGQ